MVLFHHFQKTIPGRKYLDFPAYGMGGAGLYVAVNTLRFISSRFFGFAALTTIYKFAVLYGGFAFIISLIREVIKDMEDMEGDARYHCARPCL